jgi:hypothetical protein
MKRASKEIKPRKKYHILKVGEYILTGDEFHFRDGWSANQAYKTKDRWKVQPCAKGLYRREIKTDKHKP